MCYGTWVNYKLSPCLSVALYTMGTSEFLIPERFFLLRTLEFEAFKTEAPLDPMSVRTQGKGQIPKEGTLSIPYTPRTIQNTLISLKASGRHLTLYPRCFSEFL